MARKKAASAKSGSDAAKGSRGRKAGRAAGSKGRSRPGQPATKDPANPDTRESVLEALRESERKYRALVEQSLQGLLVMQGLRIVFANPAFAEISLSPEQVTALVHPDDQALVWKRFEDRLAGKPVPPRYEYRLIRKDGSVRWLEMFAGRIEYGGKPAIQGTFVDLTDRKRAAMKIEEEERFLERVFDAVQDGITVRDRDLTVIRTNRWVERKFASEMPLVGKKCYRVFQKRDSPCPWCPAIPTMETGKPHSQVVPYPSAENPTGWFELTAFPLEDAQGNVVGAIEHVKDITESKRAEERLRFLSSAVEQTSEGIAVSDLQGKLLFVNDAFAEMYGYRPEELVGKHLAVFHAPEQIPSVEAANRQIQETGGFSGEIWHARRDGTVFPTWMHNSLLRDEAGNPVGMIGTVRDITVSKRAEEALREEKERAQNYLDVASVILVAIGADHRITLINRKGCEVLGRSEGEVVGENWFDVAVPQRERERVRGVFTILMAGEIEPVEYFENPMVASDGTERIIGWHNTVLEDPAGNIVGTLSSGEDITERKRTEEALDFERRQLLSIFDSIDEAVYVSDPKTYEVLYANRPLRKRFGDVVGQVCYRVIQGLESPCPFCTNDRILGENVGQAYIWEHRNRVTGRWYRCIDRAIRWPDGRTVRCEMAIDVTERKRAVAALRESEEQFRGIAERSFDTIFTMDLQGNLTYLSPAVEGAFLYKPEEMLGRPFTDFLPESEVPRALRRLSVVAAGEEVGVVQAEALRKDGSRISIELNSSPILEGGQLVGIQGIIRDVTERRAAEEELQRMEAQLAHVGRLSTMGELVGSIAHEVSQPLYSVLNFAKASRNVLTGESEPNLDDLRDWSEQIAAAASRAGQIIARLRSFVRRTELQRSPADINEVVGESVELVAFETRRHQVAVRLELDEKLPVVHVDRVQIQQVLVNLLRNAWEALDQIPAGTRCVILRTSRAGESVEVSVSDNGPGLPPKEDLNLFEAFATSKPGGLGIGLAISRTIIEAHGGALWADPAPDGGATFHFTLPISRGAGDGTRTDRVRRGRR